MKKSDLEKQLKHDLSAATPSNFDKVWEACATPEAEEVLVAERIPVTAHDGRADAKFRKPLTYAAIALLALLACLAVVLYLTLSGSDFIAPSTSGYFLIDVNPSVKVAYNESGVVTAAYGLNADGEELLSGLELNGKTYDVAADEIFEQCFIQGYLSAEREDNAILMTASKANGEKDETITEEIKKCLEKSFEKKKATGTVISDVDNSKWQDKADEYNINGQKYELILRYLEFGGALDEADYESITIRELYTLISKFDKNLKDK